MKRRRDWLPIGSESPGRVPSNPHECEFFKHTRGLKSTSNTNAPKYWALKSEQTEVGVSKKRIQIPAIGSTVHCGVTCRHQPHLAAQAASGHTVWFLI
jgi:hypothetical protein